MEILFATLYALIAAAVTVHVLQTKSEVRAALAWIAVAWLSPFFGAFLYFVFGINRVSRRALHLTGRNHLEGAPVCEQTCRLPARPAAV